MRRARVGFRLALAIATTLLALLAFLACAASSACSSARLPGPDYVKHPTESLELVTYPPPPARVEFVPPQPDDEALWVDGEWRWQGTRWAWKQGRWVKAPENASFAPWTTVRDSAGLLYWAEGRWRDDKGRELPDPTPLAVGRVRGGTVTDPQGEQVSSPPDLQPQTPSGGGKDAGTDSAGPETPSGATPRGTEPTNGTLDAGLL